MVQRVAQRSLLIGLAVRFILSSGLAVEAFYALASYPRRRDVLETTLGIAAWVSQALIGISALTALVAIATGLGFALVAATVALLGGVADWRRRGRAG